MNNLLLRFSILWLRESTVTGTDTVSTFELAKATGISYLISISHYSAYIALPVWFAVLIGLIRRLLVRLFFLKSQLLLRMRTT